MYLWILLFTSTDYDWMDKCVYCENLFLVILFFLPKILFPLSSSVQSLSSSHAIWPCCLCNPLDTHTHTHKHTVSLNIGQLSMSAAGGLTLELDFHISSFCRIHTELPSGGVYYDVLKCISIVYMFIPPHSDERGMWDEICVWPDWWFT